MRQCPNCKTNNPDDARFCNYCGMRLPESKEENLYSELSGLEETPKVDFSDKDIEEISEELEDTAQLKVTNEEKESGNCEKTDLENITEKLEEKSEASKKSNFGEITEMFETAEIGELSGDCGKIPEEDLRKQFTIPDNLREQIEKVTKEELEQELHKKIKLREEDIAKKNAKANIDEPTRMIGSKQTDETDEPTRMFTGDIGDFIKKKKDYEEVPEEDAYEEILQSWERKRKEKQIKRKREGKDPSRIPKIIRETRSWSDLTERQQKIVKRTLLGVAVFAAFCGIGIYHNRPEAVIDRYCTAYVQENWKKTGRMSDIPENGLATMDEYVSYMKEHAVTDISDYQMKETKEDHQTEVESSGKRRAFTITYKKSGGDKTSEKVILEKQKSKKLLLFSNWKVSTDQMIARDYNLYIPSGGQVWIDDTELGKDYKVKEEKESLDQYKVSLFEGEHKIKVKIPWFQTYETTFQASDKGSMTAARMKISGKGRKKLDKRMKQTLKSYIDAAKAGKSFSKVEGLLDKDAMKDPETKKENKEFYNDLKEALKTTDGYRTEKVSLSQYQGKYVINGVTGEVRGTLSYNYVVTYSQASGETTDGSSSDTAGQSDGSTMMSAEFIYKDGDYQIISVDPGSIWYRQ